MTDRGNRPLDVLEAAVGTDVVVKLKGGDVHEGRLVGYDQHMNLVVDAGDNTTIIRGDNVVSINP